MSVVRRETEPDSAPARAPGSLAETALVREGALALACAAHEAAPGEYCWPGAGGICQERLRASPRPAPPPAPALRPGELERLAEATRRARRDARLRTDRRTNR